MLLWDRVNGFHGGRELRMLFIEGIRGKSRLSLLSSPTILLHSSRKLCNYCLFRAERGLLLKDRSD
uniref:Uncharacterized protein n=1 Tax=Rhizophora mucronata TaxID=61149 RepID=A0A2P2MB31_RHIMU